MMNTFKKIIIIFLLLFVSCSSDSTTENNTPPTASGYITPLDNQLCTGTMISPSEINVDFEWEPFMDNEDTDLNYTLTVTNLLVNAIVITQNLTTTQTSAILERGISYAWIVSATDSSGETVAGETWQFQTPLEAESNYAPFPAILITPDNGQVFNSNGTQYDISFNWEGNDPDTGETEGLVYDLYFGPNNPPISLLLNDFPLTSINEIHSPGIYYWKIVSKDQNGNTSESVVHQYIVD